jgi:uncharacterized protein GlcG (DUF336 family)
MVLDGNAQTAGKSDETSEVTFSKSSITAAAAVSIVMAGAAKSAELGLALSIAVVDESGLLKGFVRQDGASVVSGELATQKAYTAVAMGFGVGTDQLAALIDGDRPLELNFPGRSGLCFVGGGLPLSAAGKVVGAVGVAGGHYTQDGVVAQAAPAVFGDLP